MLRRGGEDVISLVDAGESRDVAVAAVLTPHEAPLRAVKNSSC